MKTLLSLTSAATVVAALTLSAPAAQAELIISTVADINAEFPSSNAPSTNQNGMGQTLQVADIIDSNTSATPVPAPSSVFLTGMTFFKGFDNLGDADDQPVFLKVYEGNPTGSGVFVAASVNSVDFGATAGFDPLAWSFDNVELDFNNDLLFFVMSSDQSDTALNDVRGRLIISSANTGGGAFAPYDGGAAVVNGNTVGNGRDLQFEASFVIPEPGSMSLLVSGLVLVGLRKRRSTNA